MIHNQKRNVRLLVFNIDSESVREVIVVPDFDWGGEGCLGCDVASGALHRIPLPLNSSSGTPLEVPVPSSTTNEVSGQYRDVQLDASSSMAITNANIVRSADFQDDNSLRPIPGLGDSNATTSFL